MNCIILVEVSSSFLVSVCYLLCLEYTGAYSRKHDIEDLYIAVKAYHNNEMQKQKGKKRDNLQHPYLIPRLRRYQKEAVQWMLDQENTEVNKPDGN